MKEASRYRQKVYETNRPMYIADVRNDFERPVLDLARMFLGTAGMLAINPLTPIFFVGGMIASTEILSRDGEVKKRKLLGTLIKGPVDAFFGPDTHSFRNAILAEKAERIIAPQLRQKLRKKPTIGILYGTFHQSIPDMLRNPNMRRRTLARIPLKLRKQSMATRIVTVKYDPARDIEKREPFREEIRLPAFTSLWKRAKARIRLARQKMRK